jgi:glycosyltransferase involved in cell wall biosynthesis
VIEAGGAPSLKGPSLRVEAVVSGRLAPSTRFRVLQHVAPLRGEGVEVHAQPPRISKYASAPASWSRGRLSKRGAQLALPAAKLIARVPAVTRSWRADATWLEREILPGRTTLEPLLHRPLIFDVDDAIWMLSSGHEVSARTTAQRASCVIAGNDFLADWFSRSSNAVERVWTAVDTERFRPGQANESEFVVGWTGSDTTFPYLEAIGPALGKFLAQAPESRLIVMSNFSHEIPGVPSGKVEFVPWSPAVEASALASFDVGLMPLPNSDWARGKCAFKMLQYLSCGVSAVVSPVGMNAEVLAMADVGLAATNDDDWVEALLALYENRDRARELGRNGRSLVEASFSVPVIARQLATVMKRYG